MKKYIKIIIPLIIIILILLILLSFNNKKDCEIKYNNKNDTYIINSCNIEKTFNKIYKDFNKNNNKIKLVKDDDNYYYLNIFDDKNKVIEEYAIDKNDSEINAAFFDKEHTQTYEISL